VQGEVERALAVLLRVSEPVRVAVAGRTDAGVHAWEQVCSYAGPPLPVPALNGVLPDDVAALSCVGAADGFDARRDATSRAYCYRVLARDGRSALLRGRVLHWRYPVDFEALRACVASLVGTHDFTAFTPTDTEHVRFSRDVYAAFWRLAPGHEHLLEFWIEADAFMRNMVRVLVGTMLDVGRGQRSVESFRALLTPGRGRGDAGPTAPAHGLYLAGVGYGGVRVMQKCERGSEAGVLAGSWGRGLERRPDQT
jgi:tRNA pseudouridine38-40 synthase